MKTTRDSKILKSAKRFEAARYIRSSNATNVPAIEAVAQRPRDSNYILGNATEPWEGIFDNSGQLSETISAASRAAALDSFPVLTCTEIGGTLPIPLSVEGRAHHGQESFPRMVDDGNNVTGCR
ncbi:hypothetical protein HN011_009849 [Eciton burchellii]|nr:hypothetical protein HN011_009849 [Eciton burchellii]